MILTSVLLGITCPEETKTGVVPAVKLIPVCTSPTAFVPMIWMDSAGVIDALFGYNETGFNGTSVEVMKVAFVV